MTFTNGPVNLIDPDTIDQLATLIDRLDGIELDLGTAIGQLRQESQPGQ